MSKRLGGIIDRLQSNTLQRHVTWAMPGREIPPPHYFTAGSVPLVIGLFCGSGVYSGIMGDIPAARYREQVIGESHGATQPGDPKDPLHLLPSVSGCPTTTHV